MEREEIFNKVVEILTPHYIRQGRDGLGFKTRFREDLGFDSLDNVEFIMYLEDEFSIKFPDDKFKEICTDMESVVDYLDSTLNNNKETLREEAFIEIEEVTQEHVGLKAIVTLTDGTEMFGCIDSCFESFFLLTDHKQAIAGFPFLGDKGGYMYSWCIKSPVYSKNELGVRSIKVWDTVRKFKIGDMVEIMSTIENFKEGDVGYIKGYVDDGYLVEISGKIAKSAYSPYMFFLRDSLKKLTATTIKMTIDGKVLLKTIEESVVQIEESMEEVEKLTGVEVANLVDYYEGAEASRDESLMTINSYLTAIEDLNRSIEDFKKAIKDEEENIEECQTIMAETFEKLRENGFQLGMRDF